MTETLRYMIAGYVAIFGLIAWYVARLYWLARRLEKDRAELNKTDGKAA